MWNIRKTAAKQTDPALITKNTTLSYDELATLLETKIDQKNGIKPLFQPSLETILHHLYQRIQIAILHAKHPKQVLEEQSSFFQQAPSRVGADLFLTTSGSLSEPKIAALTLENLLYSAIGSNRLLKINPTSRYLCSLPFYHVGGLLIPFRALLAGASAVIDEVSVESILHHRITHISLVPTQLQRLIDDGLLNTNHSLKMILLGGAPIPQELITLPLPVVNSYSLTEMCAHTLHNGRIVPFRELRITQSGEICVKGPTLFKGYLQSDYTLSLPLDEEGWFHTKDLGILNHNRTIDVLGRMDRMFISGGENIYPEEIESALKTLPGISNAVVRAKSCTEYGMRPIAFISETSLDSTELLTLLKERLPSYKIPVEFHPIELLSKYAL